MRPQEAYEIIKKQYPLHRLRGCLDFGRFYAFCIAPIYVDDDEDYLDGTTLDAVDKRTGRLFDYDITSDIAAYERATKVNVKTLFDTKLSEM